MPRPLHWILIGLAAHCAATICMSTRGDDDLSETQIEMAALNDTYRVARGLDPHRLDADLCRLCQRHAEWMASRGSIFHGSGENIVAYGASTCTGAMGLWRNSAPHRGWMLSNTTRAGWGHAVAANGVHYWAGAFRSEPQPADSTPEPTPYRPRFLGWLRRR